MLTPLGEGSALPHPVGDRAAEANREVNTIMTPRIVARARAIAAQETMDSHPVCQPPTRMDTGPKVEQARRATAKVSAPVAKGRTVKRERYLISEI